MRITRRVALCLAVAGSLGLAGCGDDANPDERSEDELNALRIRPDAPPLERTDTSFYAKKGEDREVAIYFTDGAGGRGTLLFLLRVFGNSLLARPDGTPIALGDSVLITARVVDPTRVLIDLQPDGLTFDASAPPELLLHYDEVDDDFDGDGDIDADDVLIETRLTIWRQEDPGEVFVRLPSTVNPALQGVATLLRGFSRYAISY
ncbi:MAG: hypothetical protein H0T86_03575 [Gemmatimonadales bacterium]|nr:hypothetical protein [Gemmatimonadales bacterium]